MLIPKFSEFCDLLYDRLDNVIHHYEFLNHRYSLIVNLIDRSNPNHIKEGEEILIYGGVDRQRWGMQKEKENEKLAKYWTILKDSYVSPEKTKESKGLLKQYKEGGLSLKDIVIKNLSDYFKIKIPTKNQIAEREIYNEYFDLKEDKYISLPLIQFANFDGVVHIGFRGSEAKRLKNPRTIRLLIKALSYEYEALILDWADVGENINKFLEVDIIEKLKNPEFYEKKYSNPLLKELGFLKYYERSLFYYKQREEISNEIPSALRKQYRQTAIITILVDSFAHNISAHSLTALNWWFQLRAEIYQAWLLSQQNPKEENFEDVLDNYSNLHIVRSIDNPLNNEIHPLLKFLFEKGAFWTGITREHNFGGEIHDLYSLFWEDFINNPLYLGTIAFSEGVLKLHINFTILGKPIVEPNKLRRAKTIKETKEGLLLDGRFATINLKDQFDISARKEDEEHSGFIEKDPILFDAFKEILSTYKVFFPSGVVAKHALFTLIENEIRNIKHFSKETLDIVKEEGLILNIGIEEAQLENRKSPDAPSFDLFKIGIWLKHQQELSEDLIERRLDDLWEDIIDDDFKPRLGGRFQDKICASMLLNNRFRHVQRKDKFKRDQKYYPWVKVGTGRAKEEKEAIITDFEISARRIRKSEDKKYFEKIFDHDIGYLKKFFNLWKGANIYRLNPLGNTKSDLDQQWENLWRFRFLSIPPNNEKIELTVKKAGVFRVIEEEKPTISIIDVYNKWLNHWFQDEKYSINFMEGDEIVSKFVFDESGAKFYNTKVNSLLDYPEITDDEDDYTQHDVLLNHGGVQTTSYANNVSNFRSHGSFVQDFCKGVKHISEAQIAEEQVAEIIETFMTKVCVFDNRIANRFKKGKNSFFTNTFHCAVYEENAQKWEDEKRKGFHRYQFLVVHLSFIEAFRENNEKKYTERDIGKFIDEQICQGKEKVKDNFILIITTGRARTEWWTNLINNPKKRYRDYAKFTSFRPVEMLITAVEGGLSIKDDFEVKHRLIKVLFGS